MFALIYKICGGPGVRPSVRPVTLCVVTGPEPEPLLQFVLEISYSQSFQDMVFRTWDLNFGAWIFTLAVSKTET